jgi:hypothetical protein
MLNRFNLYYFIEEFKRSVALFELLERGGGPPSVGVFGGDFIYYRIIAARDGALNIFHFGCSLEAVQKQLPTCPALARKTSAVGIRNAVKKFREYFPHCDNVRHAVAHTGEQAKNPRVMRQNEQKASHEGHGFSTSAGGQLVQAIYERTYTVTLKGDFFTVQLDPEETKKLTHVRYLVDFAFANIAAPDVLPPLD